MAEYIDREKLLELINEDCKYQNPTNEYTRGCNEVCDWAIKTIKNIPTADVVPKSEVEKEVVEYIEKHLQYQRKKVDVPFTSRDMRNYQCGAIDVIEYFEELIAELKKKYTESENG